MQNSKQSVHIPLKNVKVNDDFWLPFMERVRTKVIPYQWEALNDRIPGAEPSFCIRNFRLAAQITHPELDYGVPKDTGHGGFVFQDSDLAKWLEAAAYSLSFHPDAALEKTIDEAVDLICNAQQSDGYLNTYYIITGLSKRFTNLRDNHELYCFGHFAEAAAAYYESTGKRKLLDALLRYAECIDRHIGSEPGKLHAYPGHEIAEMALVRLYEITKDENHLKLARYFIEERGRSPLYFEEEGKRAGNDFYWKDSHFQYQYYQAGKPVKDQKKAEGHAVRAVYLYSGMADVARLSGDKDLQEACETLFANITQKQMYITGAVGQSAYGESFSFDYDLPSDTAYAETCAAIGLAFFAKRLAASYPRGVYADTLERALYNGILSGMSLDGQSFFYVNPLEVLPEACRKDRGLRHVKTTRQKWFGCACCPPNLARIIAALGGYIHSANAGSFFTHLYIGSEASLSLNGKKLLVKMTTRYPWEGNVVIKFSIEGGAAAFEYGFRIPRWCESFELLLNGKKISFDAEDGYGYIKREWQDGDALSLNFEMPVNIVETNPLARQNIGKAAVLRGPIVYCLEEVDNGAGLWKIRLGKPRDFKIHYDEALGGLTTISFTGKALKDWQGEAGNFQNTPSLYRPIEEPQLEDKTLKFIPYYAWANRGEGEMAVWVRV